MAQRFADIMCLDAFTSATDLTREEYMFTEQDIDTEKSVTVDKNSNNKATDETE